MEMSIADDSSVTARVLTRIFCHLAITLMQNDERNMCFFLFFFLKKNLSKARGTVEGFHINLTKLISILLPTKMNSKCFLIHSFLLINHEFMNLNVFNGLSS